MTSSRYIAALFVSFALAVALPILYDQNPLWTTITLVVTGLIIVPMLFFARVTYLGWTKEEITHHITPFKTDKKYWELLFGEKRKVNSD